MIACGVITLKGTPCTNKLNMIGRCRVPKHNIKKKDDNISQLIQNPIKLPIKDMKLQYVHETIVVCNESIEVNIDGWISPLHDSIDKLDQTKIINDDILSDETYISDDEEEEHDPFAYLKGNMVEIDDNSDNECLIHDDGYESENDGYLSDHNDYKEDDQINDKSDTAFMQSIIQKQLEQEQKEQEIARKSHWLEEERLRDIEIHQRAIDAIAERKALQQAEIEAKTIYIAEQKAGNIIIEDDEGNSTEANIWDPVIFPSDNHELDINRVWSDKEICSMRDNNWYKLCSLLPKNFWIDIDYQMRIIYAFKRETSLNDSQRYWMILDLYESIIGNKMAEKSTYRLANDINMKTIYRPDEYEDMHTTWVQIKKIIKSKNSEGFSLWEKARKQCIRQTKSIEIVSDDNGLNSFIAGVALGTYKASVLYGMYLTKDPSDVLTVQKFGKALNSRGLKSKRIKINKVAENCYVLTQESISTFLNSS